MSEQQKVVIDCRHFLRQTAAQGREIPPAPFIEFGPANNVDS
jgi:hypothetical protein